jgi:hypothetical protein
LPSVNISFGELLDRFSILSIKQEELGGSSQGEMIERELDEISSQTDGLLSQPQIFAEYQLLLLANRAMWDAMQSVYDLGPDGAKEEPDLLLAIIERNKDRAFHKRKIDLLCNSDIREAKSFFSE